MCLSITTQSIIPRSPNEDIWDAQALEPTAMRYISVNHPTKGWLVYDIEV